MTSALAHLTEQFAVREIEFSYDDAGNVTQVIPPGLPTSDNTTFLIHFTGLALARISSLISLN